MHAWDHINCEPYRDLLAEEKPLPAANRPREHQRLRPSIVPGARRRCWRLCACATSACARRECSAAGCFQTRAAYGPSLFHPTTPRRLYSICSGGAIWGVGSASPASGGSSHRGAPRLLGPGRAASPGTTAETSARRRGGRRSRWWRALRRQRSSHVYSGVRACGRGATATATGAGAGVLLCSSQTACLARCESGSGDTMLPACQTSSPRASSQCATLPDGRATTWRAGRRDSGKGGAEHSSSLGGRSGTYLGFNVGTAPLQFLLPKPAAVVSPSTCRRNPERGAMQERRAAR